MSGIVRTLDKAPNSNLKSFSTTRIFTTNQLIIDPNFLYNGVISSMLIQNRDTVNALTVRINHGEPFTIAPNISIPFNEMWVDLLDLTPDPVTGNGSVIMQIVSNKELI